MQKGKILFTDLDGTLLSDDLTVSEKNKKAIKEALLNGTCIAAATGRPLASGKKQMESLGLMAPGCYLIAFNGSILYDCFAGKILYEKTISLPLVRMLFQKAEQAGIYIQTYDKSHILTRAYTKELNDYSDKTGMPYRLLPNLKDALQEEPCKALLICQEGKEALCKFKRENEIWAEKSLNSFFSCQEYLEYCPKGVDKGAAVQKLCSILQIPPAYAVAVGDEGNDISMLRAAGVGAAVKNAAPEVKEAADYVTENDHNHDAVAEVVEKFF